jgi:L-threonylcarbamoyladenylate synthase
MTLLLAADDAGIAKAAAMLRDGQLVAFGTETVYGLGARADNEASIAAIYHAKQRPSHNPLICHYSDSDHAAQDVALDALAAQLAQAFWPGPLTLVLPRNPASRIVPAVAPAGPIAVRVPSHPIAQRLLGLAGVAIAAPSANRSGRISPTTAAHVLEGLAGRIDAVLDCGPCPVGLESTVIELSAGQPALLRQGGIEQARIEAFTGPLATPRPGALLGPGQLAAHYAPLLPLRLEAGIPAEDEALLAFGAAPLTAALVYQLSAGANLVEAAARLFDGLRFLDAAAAARGLRGIAAMPIPQEGLGAAINDRLARAAQRGER